MKFVQILCSVECNQHKYIGHIACKTFKIETHHHTVCGGMNGTNRAFIYNVNLNNCPFDAMHKLLVLHAGMTPYENNIVGFWLATDKKIVSRAACID